MKFEHISVRILNYTVILWHTSFSVAQTTQVLFFAHVLSHMVSRRALLLLSLRADDDYRAAPS